MGKSFDDKWDILDNIENNEFITRDDLSILECLSWDKNYEVRNRIAQILVRSNSNVSEGILIRLLVDKDSLVRANAADSLCISTSLEVLNLMKNRLLKERRVLVKGYLAQSIADIAINTKQDLKQQGSYFRTVLLTEKSMWVKLNLYKVLYMCGEEVYLDELIDELNNKSYVNRISTIALLYDIVSKKNEATIINNLNELLIKEKVKSVQIKIKEVLHEIEKRTYKES